MIFRFVQFNFETADLGTIASNSKYVTTIEV